MDLKNLKTPLKVDEIDFRIQSINKGGYATILAYKDARVDMNRLDDVCGAENWQRDHKELKNVIYAGVGIYISDRWIWKWDAGAESFTEKQKGEASDSFKRGCFNWGIGIELYDYPVIQIQLKMNDKKDAKGEWYLDNGKPKQGWGLKLKEWKWKSQFTDNKLTYLACKDNNGNKRFEFGEYIKK